MGLKKLPGTPPRREREYVSTTPSPYSFLCRFGLISLLSSFARTSFTLPQKEPGKKGVWQKMHQTVAERVPKKRKKTDRTPLPTSFCGTLIPCFLQHLNILRVRLGRKILALLVLQFLRPSTGVTSRKRCRAGHGKTAEKQPKHPNNSCLNCFGSFFPAVFWLFYRTFPRTHSAPFSAVFNVGHLAPL